MSGAESRPPFRPENQARPLHDSARRASSGHAAAPQIPHNSVRPDEVHVTALPLDAFARLTLALMRLQFQTFAVPETHGWLMALRRATTHVGPRAAGGLCYDLVALVQALRLSRASPFAFNPDGCTNCRVWLTPDERRMMELLDALRNGRTGRARAVAQMLCDGATGDDLIAMAESYLRHNAPAFTYPNGPAPAKTQGDRH